MSHVIINASLCVFNLGLAYVNHVRGRTGLKYINLAAAIISAVAAGVLAGRL